MAAAATLTSLEHFSFDSPPSPSPSDADSDFEFRVPAAAAAISAADELFSGGKLVPLLHPLPPSPSPSLPLPPGPASDHASPRAARCASRWRDLLVRVSKKSSAAATKNGTTGYLKRQETHTLPLLPRASSSSSSSSDSGKNSRRPQPPSRSPVQACAAPVANLLHLVPKKPDRAQAEPLLSRASSSSSTSSSDSGKNARAPPPALRPHSPACLAAESPRVSPSGRVVFRGLERSSSSPPSAGVGAPRPRPRGMERSYSANVRVDPVINVFGFGHFFLPASPARERKAEKERDSAGGRRSKPEKLAVVLRDAE